MPMGIYDGRWGNKEDVVFPFSQYQQACRDLHKLAKNLQGLKQAVSRAETAAIPGWVGPHRTSFDAKSLALTNRIEVTAEAADQLARELAGGWAAARGQQDRINTARYNKDESDHDSGWEDFGEFFVGEDYESPPEDPPVPGPPLYGPTRRPKHPEFGF